MVIVQTGPWYITFSGQLLEKKSNHTAIQIFNSKKQLGRSSKCLLQKRLGDKNYSNSIHPLMLNVM